MKQSILFEQGKLYVVELPEKKDYGMFDPELKEEFDLAYASALANKVNVNNPEMIGGELTENLNYRLPSRKIITRISGTFPFPTDLTFDKETGMLKRIEPEKNITISGGYEPIPSESEKPEEGIKNGIWIIDKVSKEAHKARKIIFDESGEVHVWCNTWYGHHIIDRDCDFTIQRKKS